jgi:TolB-like protein
MNFRIGGNLGDVIQDGVRIYGDGVNIAARIEGLADPGGVAISGTAFDNVRNKLDCGYQFSGEHAIKNIADPVRVYKILTSPECAGKVIGEKRFLGWMSRKVAMASILSLAIIIGGLVSYYIYPHQSGRIEPASIANMAYPLPADPSIAVLPFDNMGKNPDEEYFSDGITAQIIASLSKVPYLFVVALNSTFTYKGRPVNVKQIAEELGVKYVLEGSVQRSGDRVRIIVQLIDAIDGRHIWSEKCDRQIEDIFALQDDIAMKIMAAMQVKLSTADMGRSSSIKTKNIKAYEKFLKGY